MGLAPLIVVLKTLGLWRNDERYNQAARFWARIFGINFVIELSFLGGREKLGQYDLHALITY